VSAGQHRDQVPARWALDAHAEALRRLGCQAERRINGRDLGAAGGSTLVRVGLDYRRRVSADAYGLVAALEVRASWIVTTTTRSSSARWR
jgi:hypothetical protein